MILSLLVACGDDAADAPPRTTTTVEVTTTAAGSAGADEPAVARGAASLADAIPTIDAASLMIVDYVYRNFGIDELVGARPAAEERLRQPDLADDEIILRRLVEFDAEPRAGLEDEGSPTTAALGTALHCDRVPPPAGYFDRLEELTANGGYDATHAGLAVGWMTDLGCGSAELDATTATVVDRIAADFAARTEVSDLTVEQSAVLCYLDACDRVPAAWADDVRAAQHDDGGWGPGSSNWHMTMLAVWTLEALRGAGTGAPMVSAG
ncbi:MAG TPA: hypothetical protein VJM33_07045 [Microthrixaceae bacterium]|nr:hypothetical protein [Microthrixaceae bacterium]